MKRAVSDRYVFIEPYVAGRDVLDLGCTDTKSDGRIPDPATELHAWLGRQAKTLLGIDIDRSGVEKMKEAGYKVKAADVEELALDQKFDCIVAGEILEHLSNPGKALKCWSGLLRTEGVLVVTTCNPFYIKQFWKVLHKGVPQVHTGHSCWFDPLTLCRLLDRCGYEIIEGAWIRPRRGRVFSRSGSVLRRWFSPNFGLAARVCA
jgi:2-polyprenyl-3-methyl-5-hydroxy-6-metoxy-1,4-benzoquinol methylase